MAGSIFDIVLGSLLLVRKFARPVLITMLAVTPGYLLVGTITAPQLWFDPLGPYTKVIPMLHRDHVHPGDPRRAMTDVTLALKLIHVLGAAVLFGTGLGIAFFMWMAHRTGDAAAIAQTARIVVIADALFTASAVVVQPLTGAALAWAIGYSVPRAVAGSALARALRAGRAVLAAGGRHPDRAAQSRPRGGGHRHGAARALSPAVPHLVLRSAGRPSSA